MHANNDKKPADDYVDPTKRSPFYESLENLTYDAELPPIPLSSDEEPLGEYDDKFKGRLTTKLDNKIVSFYQRIIMISLS